MELKKELEQMIGEVNLLEDENSKFSFSCNRCGDCCKNGIPQSSIALAPHDIFCIIKGLDIQRKDQDAFLRKYFQKGIGKTSGMVVYAFKDKILSDETIVCPFLKKEGSGLYKCSIDDFKPSSCRLFPLGRLSGEDNKIIYFFQKNTGCKGKESKEYTVDEWLGNRKETEEAFIMLNNLMSDMRAIINLQKFGDSNKVSLGEKTEVYDLMNNLYINNSETFDFIKNKNILLKHLQKVVIKYPQLSQKK